MVLTTPACEATWAAPSNAEAVQVAHNSSTYYGMVTVTVTAASSWSGGSVVPS